MRKAALDMVHELAKRDPRVVFIGSDLGPGTLDSMRKEMPERFFMEGINEANIIGMAAGLAMDGYIPYLNTIANFFTRRALEQIAVDLCIHNLPVRMICNGGGVVYAPLGPTHMAIEDLALMRSLPNMTAVAVSDAEQMRRLMAQTLDVPGPMYIRLGKGGDPVVSSPDEDFRIGKAIVVSEPGQVLLVTTGIMLGRAKAAAEALAGPGIACGIVHMPTVKPLDTQAILARLPKVSLVVTLEEHSIINGLGSAVAEIIAEADHRPRLKRLGLPDAFPNDYGSQDHLLRKAGLDVDGIVAAVSQLAARP